MEHQLDLSEVVHFILFHTISALEKEKKKSKKEVADTFSRSLE